MLRRTDYPILVHKTPEFVYVNRMVKPASTHTTTSPCRCPVLEGQALNREVDTLAAVYTHTAPLCLRVYLSFFLVSIRPCTIESPRLLFSN